MNLGIGYAFTPEGFEGSIFNKKGNFHKFEHVPVLHR